MFDRVRVKRREDHPEQLDEGMGRGRDRDRVLGDFSARELTAPGERIESVVVGEAHAGEHPQHDRPGDDRKRGGETRGNALGPVREV